MGLPTQVQAALDAADATLAEANGQPPTSTEQVESVQDGPDPFTASSTPEPTAEVAAKPPEPTPADDVWRARYNSLQGLFNKEVPALQQQVKSLQSDLSAAVDRLNRASEQREQQPQTPEVSAKDVDNFGADLVEMVSRVASQAIGKAAQAFDARARQFEGQIAQLQDALYGTTQQVAMTAEQSFFDRVSKLVPEWEKVNTDPAFLAWLAETDPVYGINRQAALKKAQDSLNADHAASVFMAYLGPRKPAPKGPDPLDKQVSPRGAATVAPVQAQAQTIRQADITKFYDDMRRGQYRGNEAEAARIEQIINAALSEGRVM